LLRAPQELVHGNVARHLRTYGAHTRLGRSSRSDASKVCASQNVM
jgi:hypothetical protein